MNIKDFCTALRNAKPNKQLLKNYFLDDDEFVNEILEGYNCLPYEKIENTGNLIELLCSSYNNNISILTQIGIYDYEEVFQKENYTIFGGLDANYFSINTKNDEVVFVNPSNLEEKPLLVAHGLENFIHALSLICEVDSLIDGTDKRHQQWVKDQVERCTLASGGVRYRDFFSYYYNNFRKKI